MLTHHLFNNNFTINIVFLLLLVAELRTLNEAALSDDRALK